VSFARSLGLTFLEAATPGGCVLRAPHCLVAEEEEDFYTWMAQKPAPVPAPVPVPVPPSSGAEGPAGGAAEGGGGGAGEGAGGGEGEGEGEDGGEGERAAKGGGGGVVLGGLEGVLRERLAALRDPSARELVGRMLARDPAARATIGECQEHPWLAPA
jgi:hypothetical protein